MPSKQQTSFCSTSESKNGKKSRCNAANDAARPSSALCPERSTGDGTYVDTVMEESTPKADGQALKRHCAICDRWYKSEAGLKKHKKRMHPNQPSTSGSGQHVEGQRAYQNVRGNWHPSTDNSTAHPFTDLGLNLDQMRISGVPEEGFQYVDPTTQLFIQGQATGIQPFSVGTPVQFEVDPATDTEDTWASIPTEYECG